MPDNYAEERYAPTVPTCARSRIAMVFDGHFLHAIGTKKSFLFPAVSGKPNEKGKFDYSAERQKIPY
jgi:hypothetical protein